MKKHPEKYWFGSMVLLLIVLLVALAGKVDFEDKMAIENRVKNNTAATY